LTAARQALKREQDKLPLFAAMIAENQPSPEERIEKADLGTIESTRETRLKRAMQWRKIRRTLRLHPVEDRQGILTYWNKKVYPLDPEYLADLIRSWAEKG
jgi:hypothetical protein